MKIVVVGRNGQLAKALATSARARDWPGLVHLARPEFDLAVPQGLAEMIADLRPEIVINAAAFTQVDKAESDVERARIVNAVSAGQIARGAASAGAAIIQVSTDYVFDGSRGRAYIESDPTDPVNIYGRSKLEGEQLVAAANSRHIIARTAWVYSPWGRNFVKTMLNLREDRDSLSIVADQFGNPTSASDLADALLAIAETMTGVAAGDPRWGVYHVAGEGAASWFQIARSIFSESADLGLKVPQLTPIATDDYPTPARRPADTRLNCGRLREQLGITLPSWKEALPITVRSLLNSHDRNTNGTSAYRVHK